MYIWRKMNINNYPTIPVQWLPGKFYIRKYRLCKICICNDRLVVLDLNLVLAFTMGILFIYYQFILCCVKLQFAQLACCSVLFCYKMFFCVSGSRWVGWSNDTREGEPVDITFEFNGVREFSSVHLHTNNMFTRGVQVSTWTINNMIYNYLTFL